MNKWKQIKNSIRNAFRKSDVIPVYELDYDHVLIKINQFCVYDINDKAFYCLSTGNF